MKTPILTALVFIMLDTASAYAGPRVTQARSTLAVPVVLNRSDADLYAATLAGRFAQGTDNPVLAAQAWSQAYLRRPTDPDLFSKAISANLLAGDVATAVRLARVASPAMRTDEAALALAADAFASGRYIEVGRVLADRNFLPSQRIFANHLAAYALLALDKPNQAIDLTAQATGIPTLDKATLMSRAMILNRAARRAEAGILYQSALESNITWPTGVRAYADWLVANDRKSEAIALYQRLARAGGPEASDFAASVIKVQAETAVLAPQELRTTASSGLLTIAQSLAEEGRGGAPIILFNLIAHLDPRSDGVTVALANQLIATSRGDVAKPLLMRISSTSPDYLAARTELVWLIFADDQAAAVGLARETMRVRAQDVAASRLLADVLAANRDDREAETLYSALIDKSTAAGQTNEEAWPLYFGRGGTRERQGNWPGALSDLRFAKRAAPNQPNVLNYLGYALADRGESLDEAITMLRAAVRLRPRSGSVLDSLGWALYRAGRYDEAVTTLETAASMSPALAEISEHLGDAYWRIGLEAEARMEWARTLRLDATAQQIQSVPIKIRDGLPPDPALAARRALASQAGVSTQR